MHDPVRGKAFGDLRRFRQEFYGCLTSRADAMFELTDAVLCADGPVRSLAELSLVGEHRRGHGSAYAALADGRIDVERLRTVLAGVPLPRAVDGRLVLAVDITCWLRPEAHTSPERILCHTYGRGKGQAIMIPGWPYSVIAALEPGRSSWTAPLDIQRLTPGMDAATITAVQLRQLLQRLIAAGQWQPGDPDVLVIADAGYDGPRLAWLLRDLPVQVLARLRSDRVLRREPPPWVPREHGGRKPRHGSEFVFADPATWGDPDVSTTTETRLYGTATATAWDRLHPRLTRRAAWTGSGDLPIIAGTLIHLRVGRLPSGAIPKPVWLWYSGVHDTDPTSPADIDRLWQAFLRRFDIEHTFRMLKQTLGWTCPKTRDPAAADRWTWLILAAYTQLRLARPLAADLRRPWEKPAEPDRLSPARVRRGFRHLRTKTACPAAAPKPTRPGPGRPAGHPNQRPAQRHDVHIVTASTSTKTSKNKKPTTTPRPRRRG
ncbi:hypothetical protein Val02_82680 [Virgisporangium aliadipatigenens]|uniref:Transposase IS701-like DDE domain-containing protein n=1 Tax=Virgisporangium aliadipatigenens TaxID=741659 RepID=A0A8J3YVR4_9ACTN|nr:hypothetical protein Val02_82680 [Virgisporangium aliadipatigenens]